MPFGLSKPVASSGPVTFNTAFVPACVQIDVVPFAPVIPEAPVELNIPLLVTVVDALKDIVVYAAVRFAVEAIDLLLVSVNVPVLVIEPVPSIVQLAVFRVVPPEPLYVPLIVKPAVPVLLHELVNKNVLPANVPLLAASTCNPVTV